MIDGLQTDIENFDLCVFSSFHFISSYREDSKKKKKRKEKKRKKERKIKKIFGLNEMCFYLQKGDRSHCIGVK